MTNFEKYAAYKDTGVEWIGEVPEHWDVRSLRYICQMLVSNVDKHIKPLERGVKLCNYVDVYKNEFITSKIAFMEATATVEEIKRFSIKLNDVIITKDSEDWLDIGVPALVKFEEDNLICGYHLAILRPNRFMDGAFLFRAISSQIIRNQFSIKANGVTRYGLSHGAILGSLIPLPPLPEQTRIASFLDRKTAQIDQAIAQKEQLIELLKERRQILIHNAVTRGLDPHVKMKDSGVEWIEFLPKHWDAKKLGHLAVVGNGSTPDRSNLRYWENGTVPWLNSSKVNDEIITGAEQFVTSKALKECHLPLLTSGTLLMAITGEGKTRGTVALCQIEATINQHLAFIKVDESKISSIFLLQYFEAMYNNIRADSSGLGSTKGAITCTSMKKFYVPIPPKSEQFAILNYIRNIKVKIATAIALKVQEIEKLKEYKTTLINSAVTGKIKIS